MGKELDWENLAAKVGLLAVASCMLHGLSDVWFRLSPVQSPTVLIFLAQWLLLIGSVTIAGLAFGTNQAKDRQICGLVGILAAQWLVYAVRTANAVGNSIPSDTMIFSLEAATLVVLGVNPYGYPLADGFSSFNALAVSSTPLLDGGTVEVLSYPALHFLVLIPTLILGMESARFTYNLCYTALLVLIYFRTDKRFRLLLLLPVLANSEFSLYPLSGSSDTVWVLLLALALWQWKNPKSRAILFGLACAYKQTPWLFAPFLFIRLLKEESASRAWRFTGISIVTFVAVNLPFLVASPQKWVLGIFDPILGALVPYGRGLSLLTQTNLMPFSRGYYGLLSLLALGTLLWLYWLNCSRLKRLLWLVPAIVFFFAFRSLQHYFIYSIPLLLMDFSSAGQVDEKVPLRWKGPCLTFLVSGIVATLLFWPTASPLSVKLIAAGPPNANMLSTMELEVKNQSDSTVRPRFFGRPDWHVYPWPVAEGPEMLKSGQMARYVVRTEKSYAAINERHGGRLLISDANKPDRYLASIDVWPSPELRSARVISEHLKFGWKKTGAVSESREFIELATSPGAPLAKISKWCSLPENPLEFEVWIPSSLPQTANFSLTLHGKGKEQVTFYFADQPSKGYFHPHHYYQVLAVPRETWHTVSIPVKDAFAEARFELPIMRSRTEQDIDMVGRFFWLDIVLDSSELAFARLKNLRVEEWPATGRIARQVYYSEEYSAILGDLAVRDRYYPKALRYYRDAKELAQPREIAPLHPFFVVNSELQVPKNYAKQRNWRFFLEGGKPIAFVWDREVEVKLKWGDAETDLPAGTAWTPPETGLYELLIEPESEALLTTIVLTDR